MRYCSARGGAARSVLPGMRRLFCWWMLIYHCALAAFCLESRPLYSPREMNSFLRRDVFQCRQGMLGEYPLMREASGTSWQPDNTPAQGFFWMNGRWFAAARNALYGGWGTAEEGSARFLHGVLALGAYRSEGRSTFGTHIVLKPYVDGYPLVYQSEEGARSGDWHEAEERVHERAVMYRLLLSEGDTLSLYLGFPGEPALGFPAYESRYFFRFNPVAPLGYAITETVKTSYGVMTAGYTWQSARIELSGFNGRRPRGNEEPDLNSGAARIAFNPFPAWSFQVSAGRQNGIRLPETETSMFRTSASWAYAGKHRGVLVSALMGWERWKSPEDKNSTDAGILESVVEARKGYAFTGRLEYVQRQEGTPAAARATAGVGIPALRIVRAQGSVGASVSVTSTGLNNRSWPVTCLFFGGISFE